MENTNNIQTNFNPKNYQFTAGFHRQKKVIWVQFPYNLELKNQLKNICKAFWSATQKSWYVTDNNHYRELFEMAPNYIGKQSLTKISDQNAMELEKMMNILILKGFSQNTLKTYTIEFAQLLYSLKSFPVQDLSPERLQSYFLYCVQKLEVSENQIHSRMNAIKFYFEKVLHREKMFFDIPRPKKPKLLPKTLNTNEIKKLFSVVDNSKHKIILQLCYGMGLRVSEIVKLKVEDIDSTSKKVFIARAKGKKDRYVNLPESILEDLRWYYKQYRPAEFLFEGQFGGAITTRSVQQVFKNAMRKAGIQKTIGIHGLRHSYATHLLEYGTDVSLIQKLLGHNDIKTTLLYTHVSERTVDKVVSPLDKLKK